MTANARGVAEPGIRGEQVSDSDQGEERARSIAEWTTLICSLAILIGMFLVLTYLYVVGNGDPVRISTSARLDEVRVSDEAFYVPVDVLNEGDSTASNVQIQAELVIGGETETSEFSLLTLAANDSETGIIAFSRDPREGEFTVRVASYIE
jgi:uncharacterized protein (TIGR02588 family)